MPEPDVPAALSADLPVEAAWAVYILRCADGSLYTGITTDLERRIRQHNAGQGARYTRGRGPVEFVFVESQPGQGAALQRERAIKKLSRGEKESLIGRSPRPAVSIRTAG